jgi:hypothetical protein
LGRRRGNGVRGRGGRSNGLEALRTLELSICFCRSFSFHWMVTSDMPFLSTAQFTSVRYA